MIGIPIGEQTRGACHNCGDVWFFDPVKDMSRATNHLNWCGRCDEFEYKHDEKYCMELL